MNDHEYDDPVRWLTVFLMTSLIDISHSQAQRLARFMVDTGTFRDPRSRPKTEEVPAPKVEIHTSRHIPEWFGQTTYIAKVDIRLEDGRPRTCAGFGLTSERALINLVKWLAGAAIGWNLEYQHPVVFE